MSPALCGAVGVAFYVMLAQYIVTLIGAIVAPGSVVFSWAPSDAGLSPGV
ncbi:hypothetical protein [Streptomyces sp. NPDC002785]